MQYICNVCIVSSFRQVAIGEEAKAGGEDQAAERRGLARWRRCPSFYLDAVDSLAFDAAVFPSGARPGFFPCASLIFRPYSLVGVK